MIVLLEIRKKKQQSRKRFSFIDFEIIPKETKKLIQNLTKALNIKDEVFDLIVQAKSKEQIEFIKQEVEKN